MLLIAYALTHSEMRRSVLGALSSDPVRHDRTARRALRRSPDGDPVLADRRRSRLP